MEHRSIARTGIFHRSSSERSAVHCHKLQDVAQRGLRPKALLDRLEVPELRLMPWMQQHRQWHSRGSRSREPRASSYLKKRARRRRKVHTVMQDYPQGPYNTKPYSRRWSETGKRALRWKRNGWKKE